MKRTLLVVGSFIIGMYAIPSAACALSDALQKTSKRQHISSSLSRTPVNTADKTKVQ